MMAVSFSHIRALGFLLVLFQLRAFASAHVTKRQTNAPTSAPTVQVLNGTYYGNYLPTYNQDAFLGIPFAQPPVGDLRFRQAQPLNTTWTEPRNATEYAPECIGYGSDNWVLGNINSEDCLVLNVVRPSGISPDAKLPVAVWIHGGGNTEGGSRDPRYNLSYIVEQSVYARSPIVAVSIQYRLQGWGFLFGKEVLAAGSANMGNRDQRLALHWVQENVGAFGGDPSKVTIWGESAGGFAVGAQLIAYGGRDDKLFRGAIMESGGPVVSRKYATPESWEPYYQNITRAANCSSANDTLACLRTVPTDTLSAIFNSSVTAGAGWSTQIDNDFIRSSANQQLLNGEFVKVPVIAGQNHDEGTSFGSRGVNTTADFLRVVRSSGLDNTTANTLSALYPDIPAIGVPSTLSGRPGPAQATLGTQWKRAAAFGGDMTMHAPRRFLSKAWAAQNVSSYSYVFDVLVNGLPDYIGATHFQEVAFVFHNIRGEGYTNAVAVNPFEGEPESFVRLATLMSRMWISFVVDLDPNNSGGE
jgi:carboxylesterase type B